jgi:hypothetical protein
MTFQDIDIPSYLISEYLNSNTPQYETFINEWWEKISDEQRLFMYDSMLNFLMQKRIQYLQSQNDGYILKTLENIGSKDKLKFQVDQNSGIATLQGYLDRGIFGVNGFCISQPYDFIRNVVLSDPLKIYSLEESQYKYGQKTVDLIRISINSIPDLEAIPTDPNSMADVGLRWDMILIFKKTYFFPIQIKTSSLGVSNALKEGRLGSHAYTQIEHIRERILEFNDKYLDKLAETVSQTRKKRLETIQQEENAKFIKRAENYNQSMPLYIWANQNPENISYIINLFVNTFKINTDTNILINSATNEFKEIDKIPNQTRRLDKQVLDKKSNKLSLIDELLKLLDIQITIRSNSKLPKTSKQIEALDLIGETNKKLNDLRVFYVANHSEDISLETKQQTNEDNQNRYLRHVNRRNRNQTRSRLQDSIEATKLMELKASISESFDKLVQIDKKFGISSLESDKQIAKVMVQLLERHIYSKTEYYSLISYRLSVFNSVSNRLEDVDLSDVDGLETYE